MASSEIAVQDLSRATDRKRVVNDFSIQVATVNGSGSQSANNVLLRSLFRMGIPVSGKNLFPSNIAGLPTWFTIRASKDGYLARRRETDVMVVMNPETAAEDVASVQPGGAIVLNDAIPVPAVADDRFVYRVPMKALIGFLERHRRDAQGRATFAVVQAEDEIAAIGMVLGASWAGARAMTSTSGPGLSLMAEFTGYGYYAEIPAVIWDIQRIGPSTGLPTRTSQGDLAFVGSMSHGDTRHPVLLPSSVRDCF